MRRVRRVLAVIGGAVRGRLRFTPQLAALAWGVLREGAAPGTWRQTLRTAFRATLTRAVSGSLGTIAVTGLVVGRGLVSEALYPSPTASRASWPQPCP